MLSAAVDDELLIANPAFGLGRKLGRRPDAHEEPRAMTAEQLDRFLRAAVQHDQRHYPLYAVGTHGPPAWRSPRPGVVCL